MFPARVQTSTPTYKHNEHQPLTLDANGNAKVALGTTLAGEDTTNSVFRVEQQMEYETVAASQTDQVLGATGAAGDLLKRLIIVVTTAASSAVDIQDGSNSAINVFPDNPGGGVGTYTVDLDLVSTVGAWSVTTDSGVAVIAVGRFS